MIGVLGFFVFKGHILTSVHAYVMVFVQSLFITNLSQFNFNILT